MITSEAEVTPQNMQRELAELAHRLNLKNIEEALYFPKFIFLETVRVCNARCPFCAIDHWDKSVPLMSDALFEKIVGELEKFNKWLYRVNIQKAGEPFMDRKLIPRIRRLKEAGVRHIAISTNASLLTQKKAEEVLEAGIDDIMLSIDSVEKEKYEKMRVGLEYEKVIANIRTFFMVRNEISPNTTVRVRGVSFHDLDSAEDKKEMADWEAFWKELRKPHDRIYMKRPHNWANQKTWDGHTPDYDKIYHPCILPWSTMSINTDGKVPFCSLDYDAKYNMGDLTKHTIEEVWNDGPWKLLRERHATGRRNEISFCQGCKLFDLDFSLEKNKPKLDI